MLPGTSSHLWGMNDVISSPALPHPCQTRVTAQGKYIATCNKCSLDSSPKGSKTEPGLSQQQCFECWQLYCQHDWYSDHKLHMLAERGHKQKIWPSCLVVWFHWLFLKQNSIWKLKIKTAAFCIAINNRRPASNSNFPLIYTSTSPFGLMENPPPACTDFMYFTWVTVALQSQCRGCNRDDSHRDARKSPKVFPGCKWVPCTKAGDYFYWKWDCFCTYHALAVSTLEPSPVIFSIKWVVDSVSSLISLLSWNNYYCKICGKPMRSGFTLLLLVALWETKNMLWLADWTAMRERSAKLV